MFPFEYHLDLLVFVGKDIIGLCTTEVYPCFNAHHNKLLTRKVSSCLLPRSITYRCLLLRNIIPCFCCHGEHFVIIVETEHQLIAFLLWITFSSLHCYKSYIAMKPQLLIFLIVDYLCMALVLESSQPTQVLLIFCVINISQIILMIMKIVENHFTNSLAVSHIVNTNICGCYLIAQKLVKLVVSSLC